MRMSDSASSPEKAPPKEESLSEKEEEAMDTTEVSVDAGGGGDGPKVVKTNDKAADKNAEQERETDLIDVSEDEEMDKEESAKEPETKKTPKEETLKTPPKKTREVKESEEEEESQDEEPKLGLLEQPVIIQSGKRQKRKVERLEITVSTPKETEFTEGSGTKLGEIPAIEHHITKNLADDLKQLHRILYGKVGTTTMVKKNIRKFSGFSFDADSTEYKRKEQILNKLTTSVLKPICETLTLERGGTKETLITRVMEFLINPQDTGKAVPMKRKRSTKPSPKRKKGAKGDMKKPKKVTKRKSKKEDASSDSEAASGEEESEKEEESEEEEEVQPKKKKAKPEPKKTPKKTQKKKEESSSDKDEKADDSSSDEKVEQKPKEKAKKVPKKKRAPTEDDIKETVKKILDGANLEQVTMKTVCKQVYAKYPDFDISDKKEFIKASVKQIIK